MSPTNGIILHPNSKMQIDRTASTDLRRQLTSSESYGPYSDPFIRSISKFSGSTGDGGVLLNVNTHSLLAWSIYIQVDRISKILSQVRMSTETMNRTTDHSLSLQPPPVLSPQLAALQWMKGVTGFSHERIGKFIGVSRQTIHRWENGELMKDPNRRRLFAVHGVLEHALSQHPTREELAAWLDTPRGADGRTPAQLLEANEINRARLLAVSSPSPRLVRSPAWVKRPIPEAFLKGAERRQEALPPEPDSKLAQLIENGEYGIDEDGEVFPLS